MTDYTTSLNNHWGLHTIVDLADCYPEEIANYESIELWVTTLVAILDMEPYGDPQIVRFGKDGKYGYTCTQLIQTSCITAHFSEDTNTVYIDVFSCKPYDPEKVADYCNSVFGGRIINKQIIYRG